MQTNRCRRRSLELHDGELAFVDLDPDILGAIDRLRPYGMDFPPPVFLGPHARVVGKRIVGGTHLKLTLAQEGRTIDGIMFGAAHLEVEKGDDVGCLFTPQINEWRGRKTIELRLEELWSV